MRSIRILAAGLLAMAAGASGAQQASQLVPPTRPAQAAAPTGSTVPAQPPTGKAALTKPDVDAWLDGFMPYALKTGDVAGAVVVVVKDGQILTQRGFGYADVDKRTPVDPEKTLFRPGSVSKLVTWTAVMQQVEAGKIDLDADINTYLDFRIPPRDGRPITMRQVMTHTAGFEDHAKNLMFHDAKKLHTLGDYLKLWVPKRIFAPGTTPAYSNYATALAGYVVERVSGMNFDDYVDARVLGPLGMTNSTLRQPLPARLAPQMATGYKLASGKPSLFEFVDPAPAGSMSAAGGDMGRFMIAHLNQGAGLMRPETARMMHTSATTILPPLNRMMLGFFETNVNNQQVIAHLGDTQAFHTALHLFMDQDVGLYLSVNSAGKGGAAGTIRSALLDDFADRYFPYTPRDGRVDAKTSAEHARMLAGNWRSSRRIETGVMALTGLLGQTVVSVGPKGELVIPAMKNAGGAVIKWVEIAPFVWREVGGRDRLAAKVVDGKAVRWSVDGASPFMVFDRVPASLSTSWLMPLLYAGLAILLITFLHWPASALVRRHYKAPLAIEGRSRTVYRGVRLAAGLSLGVLIGWMLGFQALTSTVANLTSDFDGVLWTLQIAGLIAFVGLAALAAWNAWLAFRDKRRWTGKVWAVLVLIAALTLLYVAASFGLIAMTVDY